MGTFSFPEQQTSGHMKAKEVVSKMSSNLNHKKWSVLKTLKICTENPLKRKIEDDLDDADAKRSRLQLLDEFNCSNVVSTYDKDKFDRRWLMLNSAQMICEGIPSPVNVKDGMFILVPFRLSCLFTLTFSPSFYCSLFHI